MISNNFASIPGEPEISSTSSSCTSSVKEYVATTVSASSSTLLARRNLQDHKGRSSSGEAWKSREERIAEIFDALTNAEATNLVTARTQEHSHEKQMHRQHWEANQQLRAEAARLAAQTSTQMMNAGFRAFEFHACAEMDGLSRSHMQVIAVKAEQAIDAQKHLRPGSW